MIKFKLFYFLLIMLFPVASYACSCGNVGVVDDFQQSGFVAKAKIIRITPDPASRDHHDAVIEIITLYKGEHLSKIKIESSLNSSCRFLPLENSTWIIFARGLQGMLSFGFCSGSLNISPTIDAVQYPDAAERSESWIKRTEGVLSFLSEHRIFNPNPSRLFALNTEIKSLKGYTNKNSFAVFQVDVNSDFSIAAIKQLKKFQNGKLNKLVFNSMNTDLTFILLGRMPLAKPARAILFCFFYPEDGSRQSCLSFINL